jgi:hypothetical protein
MSLIVRFIMISAVVLSITVVVTSLLIKKYGVNWLMLIVIIIGAVISMAVNFIYWLK